MIKTHSWILPRDNKDYSWDSLHLLPANFIQSVYLYANKFRMEKIGLVL